MALSSGFLDPELTAGVGRLSVTAITDCAFCCGPAGPGWRINANEAQGRCGAWASVGTHTGLSSCRLVACRGPAEATPLKRPVGLPGSRATAAASGAGERAPFRSSRQPAWPPSNATTVTASALGLAAPLAAAQFHAATATLAKGRPVSRSRMSLTWTALHSPPRAILMPRAISALATPRKLPMPLFCISRMIGRTLAANASAVSIRAAFVASMVSVQRGLPSLTPRAFAAASASFVR